MPEFDGVELQEWAERYGHPEEWAKRAQAAHARAERLMVERDRARSWVWRLIEAIDSLELYEPGRRGYAGVHRRLMAERDWALRELDQHAEQVSNDTPASAVSAPSSKEPDR